MTTDTYLKQLEKLYARYFPPEINNPPESETEFLDSTVMQLLLGKDIEPLKKWIPKYQQEEQLIDRPVAEFFGLTRLAAGEELLGEQGEISAKKARELLPVVSERYLFETDVALVAQKAISLMMLLREDETMVEWRKKRLEMPIFEGWETSAFEVLYVSSNLSQLDKFESLATAFARISVRTISVQAQDSIAPLILSLAAQCHKRGENLSATLDGRILTLEQEVFSENLPKIRIDDPVLKYSTKGGRPILQIVALAQGSGDLSTGSYEIAPFTTKLAPTLIAEYERRKKKRAIQDTLCNENGLIECHLKLDKGVRISSDEILSLERRMKVGFEWASYLNKEIKAEITLKVK